MAQHKGKIPRDEQGYRLNRDGRRRKEDVLSTGKKRGRPPRTNYSLQLPEGYFKAIGFYMRGETKTQSLIKAGFSENYARCAQYRIFGRADVQREIEKRRYGIKNRAGHMIERIQDELAKIAFFNIGEIVRVTEDGDLILDFADADMDQLASIGEVTVELYTEGKGRDAQQVKRVKVKPYDKKAALDSLARIHGLFKDNLHVTEENSLEKRLQAGRNRANPRLNAPGTVDAEFEVVEET